ncbi:MAG: SH3 domain-containing protein [Lachnospiraceae bacterium]|nr:SH3 domain-containing protein [Lachnospiraceae bacterium]
MKKIIPVIVAVVLILLIGGIYLGGKTFERYSYSKERADLKEYFGVSGADEAAILLNDEWIDVKAALIDGGCYLAAEDVDTLLTGRFYFGKADNELLYTTPTDVIRAEIGSSSWSSTDGDSGSMEHPIALVRGEDLWILLDYVERFADFTWDLYGGGSEPARIRMSTAWSSFDQATVTKNTELRILGGVKSEILRDLKKGDKVVVLEKMENWTKVRSDDAFIGYVENKRLSETMKLEAIAPESREMTYTSIQKPYQIDMAWHAVYSAAGNDTMDALVAATNAGETDGLNTIAPTWFALSDGAGGIESFASASYVKKAHEKGLEVWGVVDNFNNEGADTASTLSRASSRKKLTDALMEEAASVGLDGINVDFEQVPSSSGEDFIQWIRELSIPCREKGIVLSVDNYVPMGSLNDYYDRAEQGVVADYVVVMAYDEHYRGSDEAGSVASIGFVEDGIRRTAAEVPGEKIIGGIPFYTRVWASKNGEVDSDALTMSAVGDWVTQRDVTLAWDDETCQNYGEITDSDGTLRQVWVEDAESIRTKINVMRTYHVAGVAAWQLGFETPDIWDVISKALNS